MKKFLKTPEGLREVDLTDLNPSEITNRRVRKASDCLKQMACEDACCQTEVIIRETREQITVCICDLLFIDTNKL